MATVPVFLHTRMATDFHSGKQREASRKKKMAGKMLPDLSELRVEWQWHPHLVQESLDGS